MEGGDRGWCELKQKVYCKLRLGTEYKWQRFLSASNSKSGLSSAVISSEMNCPLPGQAHGLCCPGGRSTLLPCWPRCQAGAAQPQPPLQLQTTSGEPCRSQPGQKPRGEAWEVAGVKEFLRLLLLQTAQVRKGDCISSRRGEGGEGK